MTRLAARIFPILFAILSMVLPHAASAHAALVEISPAEGALLTDPPAEVVLRFSEAVSPLAIGLVGPDGVTRDLTGATSGDSTLRVALPELAQGTHVLTWRVTSDDGHPVAGSLIFSLGRITGAAEVSAGDPLVAGLLWAAKLVMSGGLILGIGGVLFGALAGLPPAAPWILRCLLWVGLVMTPMALGLHGADALGLSAGGVFSAAAWKTGFATSFGTMTILALLAGLTALAGLTLNPLAFLATVLLAAAYASAGHAGAADPQWLTRSAVFLHLAAMCCWLGALLPLGLWLRGGQGAAALKRFSDIIPFAVLLLAASGLALGMVQMGGGFSGWTTSYGRILTAKLALLAILFALAAGNRWLLTAQALDGDARAARRLRGVILIEMALVIAILGLAAGWRFTPPPRTLAAVAAMPAYSHIHAGDVMADVTFTPGRAGPVAVEIWLSDGDMQPLAPQAVTLGLAMPERGIERMVHEASVDADGLWQVPALILPLAGSWQIDLEIRVTRFSISRIDGEITIN